MTIKKRKPVKGVRYIASKLKYYYKKRYQSVSALPRAREIYAELKKSNQKVILKNIFGLETKKRKPKQAKEQPPELPDFLATANPYFNLIDYPQEIVKCTNKIWFKSKLWDTLLPDIQGGERVEYETYFENYVNYINSMKSQTAIDDKRYETEWLVMCTPPVFDDIEKKWYSEVVSMDALGDVIDYGFDPNNPKGRPSQLIISNAKEKISGETITEQKKEKISADEEKTGEKKPISKDVELKNAEIELEKQKQKTAIEVSKSEKNKAIANITKLLVDGVITKQEAKEMISNLQ
jgi:hypothetical protein